jgi:hypothetical protein
VVSFRRSRLGILENLLEQNGPGLLAPIHRLKICDGNAVRRHYDQFSGDNRGGHNS